MASLPALLISSPGRRAHWKVFCSGTLVVLLAVVAAQAPGIDAHRGAPSGAPTGVALRLVPVQNFTSATGLKDPGNVTNGEFGYSVATNGAVVVVGAPLESSGGVVASGRAYVYNATTGARLFTLYDPNPTIVSAGAFGSAVGVVGGIVVVGAPAQEYAGTSAGMVFLYNATSGHLIRNLTTPNPVINGDFGWSVAVSVGRIVVGAPGESANGLTGSGRAYVFNSTTGLLRRTLESPSPATGGDFGYSVGASGDRVLVGAPFESPGGATFEGDAYLFSASNGSLLQTFADPVGQACATFGRAVTLSDSFAIVGARGCTFAGIGASYSGAVYEFRVGSGKLYQSLSSPNAQLNGFFGASLSVSGSTLMVGAWQESVGGVTGVGRAYLYNASSGVLLETVLSPTSFVNGSFGWSVAVGATNVVVGADEQPSHGLKGAGRVYLF